MSIRYELSEMLKDIGQVRNDSVESFKIALGNKRMDDSEVDLEALRRNIEIGDNIEYFEYDGKPCNADSDKIRYKWLNTGNFNPKGESIYFGFIGHKLDKRFDLYFVGTYSGLCDNMNRFLRDNNIEKWGESKTCKQQKSTNDIIERNDDVIKDLRDFIGDKEFWFKNSDDCVIRNYLDSVDIKIKNDIKSGEEKNFKFNNDKSRLCYKISPLNKFGCDITIIAVYSAGYICKKKIAKSRKDLLEDGFDTSVFNLSPVKLYEDVSELFIMPELESFDLENMYNITHIVKERIERFPEEYREETEESLYVKIKNSIEYNIKMCKRDYKWAVPIYYREANNIQYLLPIYFTDDHSDEVKLAIIVSKENGIYTFTTVLDINTAYIDACSISKPYSCWLKK